MTWKILGATHNKRHIITIVSNGQIRWSKGVDEALGHPAYVDVLHDAESERLGLRKSDDPTAFRVYKSGCSISAALALKEIGFAHPQTRCYKASAFGDGIWSISMKARQEEQGEGAEDE